MQEQYIFIHHVLLEALTLKEVEIPCAKFLSVYPQLGEPTLPDGQSRIQREFKVRNGGSNGGSGSGDDNGDDVVVVTILVVVIVSVVHDCAGDGGGGDGNNDGGSGGDAFGGSNDDSGSGY